MMGRSSLTIGGKPEHPFPFSLWKADDVNQTGKNLPKEQIPVLIDTLISNVSEAGGEIHLD